jgi:hypothetical protein
MRSKKFNTLILVYVVLLSTVVVAQQDKRSLTNQDVIKMVKAGLPENTIVLAIQKGPNQFDTSPDALIALKEAGATQKVLDAILQAQSPPTKDTEDDRVATEAKTIPNLEGVWAGKIWQDPDTKENTNCVYNIRLEQNGTKATGQAIIECIDTFKGKVMGEFEITVTISSDGLYYKDLYINKNSHPSDSGSWCVKEGRLYYDSRKNRLYGATQGYGLIYGVKTACRTISFDLYRKQ